MTWEFDFSFRTDPRKLLTTLAGAQHTRLVLHVQLPSRGLHLHLCLAAFSACLPTQARGHCFLVAALR